MGWWNVENSEDVVGDDAYDILHHAAKEVAGVYIREFGRFPTRAEWQRLIRVALQPIEDADSSSVQFLLAEKARPREVKILLEGSDADEK
jgi:hypothetical protein